MTANPFLLDPRETLADPTPAEVASFWKQNARLAAELGLSPISYEGGIEPDESLLRTA